MTLNYNVTKEDYFHFCMYSYDHNDAAAKQVLTVRLLYGGLILLLSLLILIFQMFSNPLLYITVLWVVAILLIANTKRSLRKANEKRCRQQIEAGKGTEFLGAHMLELQENKIVISNTSRKSEIGYDSIEKVGQDTFCMYVHCGSLSAVLLPLTAFQDELQRAALLEVLKNKCNRLSA